MLLSGTKDHQLFGNENTKYQTNIRTVFDIKLTKTVHFHTYELQFVSLVTTDSLMKRPTTGWHPDKRIMLQPKDFIVSIY